MSRYNLLDEPWIEVFSEKEGKQAEISLLELFHHAQQYRCLAGEMETQNFAVMRFLLAIEQTVFSRFDNDGEPYLDVNERMQPVCEAEDNEFDRDRLKNWIQLWHAGHFTEIVCQYLEKWRDHFYLYDETYPFYQVTHEEMKELTPAGKKPTEFYGRNLNRLISESGNKTALFSPAEDNQKDFMRPCELARWLIMLQGYIGLSDKTSIAQGKQKPSKGWLFDLGGLYLKGSNLFETLVLNYIPVHPEKNHPEFNFKTQRPCWESSGRENIERLKSGKLIDNLAELYTNWSRAIYINPDARDSDPAVLSIVKLPAIEHMDNFLEPMTVWNNNQTGEFKGHFTPRKHRPDQSLWRSFGLIALNSSDVSMQKKPGIMSWLDHDKVRTNLGNSWIDIQAVSMRDDGNATSWVPVDEIVDELTANDLVISETSDNGWVVRINDTVEITKQVAWIYHGFLKDIVDIRGQDPAKEGKVFLDSETEKLYQNLNEPFRTWLAGIQPEDGKKEKVSEWYGILKKLAFRQADSIMDQAAVRDFIGIKKDDHIFNIVGAYQKFRNIILQKLGK